MPDENIRLKTKPRNTVTLIVYNYKFDKFSMNTVQKKKKKHIQNRERNL